MEFLHSQEFINISVNDMEIHWFLNKLVRFALCGNGAEKGMYHLPHDSTATLKHAAAVIRTDSLLLFTHPLILSQTSSSSDKYLQQSTQRTGLGVILL